MDFIRQQWNVIQERLAGLTPSQKMLVGALVVITVMTMLYWGRFASNRQMVALTPVPMSAEEVTTATASLRAKGISFTTNGGTIMVNSDDQMAAMSDLSFNQALPTTPNYFESMLEKISPFGTQGDYLARLNNARERTLGRVISGWPDVKTATVVVHDVQQRGIGRYEPRASVDITTRSGAGVKKLAQSATNLVLNAVSGLERPRISVMVDGQSINNSTDGVAGAGNEALDLIRQFEIAMADKVRGNFIQFIPSIVVSVTADVDTQTRKEVKETVDPTNKIVVPISTTSDIMTSTEALPTGEPGMMANAGMDATPVSTQLPGTSSEKTVEQNQVAFGKSQMVIDTPAGKARCIGAAVRVPRSYFTKLWRAQTRKLDGEPSEAELAAILSKETDYIRGEVKRLTNILDLEQIAVADFPDFDTLPVAAPAAAGITLYATSYAKEGAIGILALASLFMVSRIVKKSVPAPAVAIAGLGSVSMGMASDEEESGPSKARGPSRLDGEEDIAGDVAEGGQVLMGQELDPATLETAQMVDQVSKYVKDNPDTAATLIRRLMSRD